MAIILGNQSICICACWGDLFKFKHADIKERIRNAEAQLEKKWNFTLGEDEVELQKRQSSSPGRLI